MPWAVVVYAQRHLATSLVTRAFLIFAVGLLTPACLGLAADSPAAPTVTTLPVAVPARITSSVLYGVGNGAGRAFLVLQIFDASSRPVSGTSVTIAAANGSVTHGADLISSAGDSSITLATDFGGQVQATVIGRGAVTVNVSAGQALLTVTLSIP
jgi:hypothetical protein